MEDGRIIRNQTTYLVAFLEQHLVVLAEGDAEDDGGDVLETVDPLFALAPLAADVKHADGIRDMYSR
jgi:hypothetical protein